MGGQRLSLQLSISIEGAATIFLVFLQGQPGLVSTPSGVLLKPSFSPYMLDVESAAANAFWNAGSNVNCVIVQGLDSAA